MFNQNHCQYNNELFSIPPQIVKVFQGLDNHRIDMVIHSEFERQMVVFNRDFCDGMPEGQNQKSPMMKHLRRVFLAFLEMVLDLFQEIRGVHVQGYSMIDDSLDDCQVIVHRAFFTSVMEIFVSIFSCVPAYHA